MPEKTEPTFMGGDVRSRAHQATNIRRGWLFVAALLLQFAAAYAQTAGTGDVFQSWMLIGSYILLLTGVLANLRFWGFRLLLLGLSLNVLAMGLNGWRMPVTPESLSKAGYVEEASLAGGVDFHSPKSVVLNREDTRIPFLTDSVVLTWPTKGVVSVGDLVIVASVAVAFSELVLARKRARLRGRARVAPKQSICTVIKIGRFPWRRQHPGKRSDATMNQEWDAGSESPMTGEQTSNTTLENCDTRMSNADLVEVAV